MTWREKTVVALLLLVARIVSDDAAIRDQIRKMATHISVNAPTPADEVILLPSKGRAA